MVFGQTLTSSSQKDDLVGSITHYCMVSNCLFFLAQRQSPTDVLKVMYLRFVDTLQASRWTTWTYPFLQQQIWMCGSPSTLTLVYPSWNFNSPEKAIYLLESGRRFHTFFPIRMVQPPRCCVCLSWCWIWRSCDTLCFNTFHINNYCCFKIPPMMNHKVPYESRWHGKPIIWRCR